MNNLLLIIVLLILTGILPILRTNFFVIYYLQYYHFNLKRLWHFWLSKSGQRVFFTRWIVVYGSVFVLYSASFLWAENQYFFHISWLLIAFLAIDSLIILYRLYKHQLRMPSPSYRTLAIMSSTMLLQTGIFLLGYFLGHFFIATFILLVCPYVVIGLVAIGLYPMLWLWKKILYHRAIQRRLQAKQLQSVAIVGSYGKSYMSNMLQKLFEHHPIHATSPQYHHPTGIAQSLVKIDPKTKHLFAEMGLYSAKDSVKSCQLIKPHHVFICGIEPQHLATFGDLQTLIRSKLSIQSCITDHGHVYMHADVIHHLSDNHKIHENATIYGGKNALHAQCFVSEDGVVFQYKGQRHSINPEITYTSILEHLAGALAYYVDQGYSIENIKTQLQSLNHNNRFFKEYHLMNGLHVIEQSDDDSIQGIWSGLEILSHHQRPQLLILGEIPELGKRSAAIHYEIGKELAKYDIEKIFLLGRKMSKHCKAGLIDHGFPKSNIFFRGDLGLLKLKTEGTVLVKGPSARQAFRQIVFKH